MRTLQEFMEGIQKIEKAKAAFIELADKDVSKYEAIVMMVNQLKITWGAASDQIEMLQSITGRRLRD